jgi:hypothetical protein
MIAREGLLVFLRVFMLELCNKYHQDSKTPSNTRSDAERCKETDLWLDAAALVCCFR